jgi:hypothetical protein
MESAMLTITVAPERMMVLDCPLSVFRISLEATGEKLSDEWNGVFGSEAEAKAFLRGVEVFSRMLLGLIEVPQVHPNEKTKTQVEFRFPPSSIVSVVGSDSPFDLFESTDGWGMADDEDRDDGNNQDSAERPKKEKDIQTC